MKIDEFMETVKQMENFYGKDMSDEQKKIWFENLKSMNINRFKYVIANLYKTSKFIPKLADIFELNSTLGSTAKNVEIKEDCKKCRNTGYVIYKQIVKDGDRSIPYEYVAICDCGRKKQYKGWEISDEKHRSKYYTPLITELGL